MLKILLSQRAESVKFGINRIQNKNENEKEGNFLAHKMGFFILGVLKKTNCILFTESEIWAFIILSIYFGTENF